MNLPNSMTISRIACVPLLIWALSPHFPFRGAHGEQEIFASLLFIAAAVTDGLDGYFARRRHQVTTMGMLLDPLADKLLVTAGYICLIPLVPDIVMPWIAVLVIGREFLISGLRSIAAAEGLTIQASEVGKLKTVVQIVSIVSATLAHRWYLWDWGGFIVPVHVIAVAAIYWMTFISVLSAVDYLISFWKKIDHASTERIKQQTSLVENTKKPQRA